MKNTAVLFLGKNKGAIYTGKQSSPVILDFNDDIIQNLEITDREKLKAVIISAIKTNAIQPSDIIIILQSGMLFDEVIKDKQEANRFLEIVPFHNIMSKTVTLNDENIIYATNYDLVSEFIKIIEDEGFGILGIIPSAVLNILLPDMENKINVHEITKKLKNSKEYSLYSSHFAGSKGGFSILKLKMPRLKRIFR